MIIIYIVNENDNYSQYGYKVIPFLIAIESSPKSKANH